MGHIAYGKNRFLGADVFGTLEATIRTPSDLLVRAFGGRALDDSDREVLRCLALAVTSPDARVWPLKLARVLASHGNLYAAFHGAGLANATEVIGPNAVTNAARVLAAISDEAGEDLDDEPRIAATIARVLGPQNVIGGFGVPFRDEDERLVELSRLLADHPIVQRRHWRLSRALAAVIRQRSDTRPNVVSAIAAIALDLGIAPGRAGLFLTISMAHTFAAHALEACDHDGELLRELPFAHVDYRGTAPRRSR